MNGCRILATLLLIGTGLCNVQAGHVAGGEIFWKSLNKDTLLVSINIYRDCSGSNIYNAPLTVTTACGASNYKTSVVVGREMLPLCDTVCSKCDTPSTACTYTFGLQKWTLSAVVPLKDFRSKSCCELNFSWGLCCRNNGITTGASQENLYLHAGLNVCDSAINEVSWHDKLLTVICLGQDIQSPTFNMTSTSDSDSVVHTLIEPRINASKIVSYNSPYDYNKPIYFLGFPKATKRFPQGMHLDVTSGLIQFRPMKVEVATICVRAEIYRNGRRVGYSVRDQYVKVVKCLSNTPPSLSGSDCKAPTSSSFEHRVCIGEKIEFDICSSDKDKDDTVRLNLTNTIPGASLTVINKGSQLETARFSWTPTAADVRNTPYQFVVDAKDNACPLNGEHGRVFTIYVSKSQSASIDTTKQACGNYLFHAKAKNPIYFNQFDWQISSAQTTRIKTTASLYDTVPMQFDKPGTYLLYLKAYSRNRCALLFNDSISIPHDFLWIEKPAFNQVGCPDDSIDLKLISHPAFGTPTIVWNSTDTTNATTSIHRAPIKDRTSRHKYSVQEGSCLKTGYAYLQPYEKHYVTIPKQDIGCFGADSFVLEPFSSTYSRQDSITSFYWTDISNNIISTDSTLAINDSGFYLLKTTSVYGCQYIDTFYSDLKVPAFELPIDTAICQDDITTFKASSKSPGTFDWHVSNSQLSFTRANQSTLQLKATEPTKVVVQFNDSRGGITCIAKDSFILDTFGLPKLLQVSHDEKACKGDSLQVTSVSDSAIWTFQDQKYYGAKTYFPVLIDNQKERQYPLFLTSISAKGCKSDTEMTVMLYMKPSVSFTIKDSIPAYKNYQPTNTSPWNATNFHQWTIGNPVFKKYGVRTPTFKFDTLGSFKVTLTITDSAKGCSQSYSDTLKVVHNIHSPSATDFDVLVYPNPASSTLHVRSAEAGLQVEIFGMDGKTYYPKRELGKSAIIDVSHFTQGLYVLRLHGKNTSQSVLVEIAVQ